MLPTGNKIGQVYLQMDRETRVLKFGIIEEKLEN